MSFKTVAITASVLLALTTQTASAANAVGYNFLTVPANTDVTVTAPFTQTVANTLVATGKDTDEVFVAGGLTAGQYNKTTAVTGTIGDYRFYVRFTSGAAEGLWSSIESNTADRIQLQDTAILSSVANGDSFVIYPHQTLATVFPAGMVNVSFIASTLFARSTEVYLPNMKVGINKPSVDIFYFYNNAWRKSGKNVADNYNNIILPPQQYFTVRNRSASPLKYFALGKVAPVSLARILVRDPLTKNDVSASAGFPMRLTLAQLNLGGTPAFANSSLFTRGDELKIFNNQKTGINKASVDIFFFYNGAWRKSGQPIADNYNNYLLDPGAALLITRLSGSDTAVWFEPMP